MIALTLSLALAISPSVPADDTDSDTDACLALFPAESRSALPVGSLSQAERYWTRESDISSASLTSSISRLRRARSCLRSLPPAKQTLSPLVRSFYWEGILQAALRQFPDASEAFDNALSVIDEAPKDSARAAKIRWKATLHQDWGYLHFLLGDLSSSIEHYLKAFRSTPKDQVGQRIRFLVDVGILHQRTQDYQSARHYYQRAHQRLGEEQISPENRTRLRALTHHARADVLLEETLSNESDPDILRRARTLARQGRRLATPGTERYARLSILLSESLGHLGSLEKAYRLNEEVRQYALENDLARPHTLSLLKRGGLHVQTERWSRADSVLRKALTQSRDLNDLDYRRRVLRDLGRLHEIQGHWTEAEQFYRKAVAVVEQYRQSLTASQWSLTAFSQWRNVHRGLVRTLIAQDRPREALTALDQSRARHLQDLRTQARISNQLPPKKRTRLDSLSRTLTDVRNRLGDPSLPDSVEATLRSREAALMAARQQLIRVDSAPDRSSLDAISETLAREDRALVSYFLDDPRAAYDRAPRSVAFVLTGDTLRTVPLPGLTQDSLDTSVEATSPLFTDRDKPDRANAMHFDLRPLSRLYDAVYTPVADALPDDRPLTIVPDGPLFHLPFSMLVDSMPGGRYAPAEARYVLHERSISLELASSLVADTSTQSLSRSQFRPQLAAYGVSRFDTLRTAPSALRSTPPDALDDSSVALPSLPGVRDELQTLKSTIPNTEVALNGEATEADFCRSAQTAGVLHVASHAFVNASSPLRNAILLRPDSSAQSSADGVLFLHELQDQQSQIPMVVLSGCNTASGTLRGGEGMEGLQYAFRAMGAQSTISTLWPVADQASVTLMDAFYEHLRRGYAKDAALRQAQLDFLNDNPKKASPFFWAAPVLYGSPVALPLDDPSSSQWRWGAVALGGLVLLLLGWWLWARVLASPRFSLAD